MGLAEIELKTATYYAIAEANNGTSTITRTTDTNEEVTASSSFNSTSPYYVPMQKGTTKLYYAVVETGATTTQFNSNTGTDQWTAGITAENIAGGGMKHYDAYSQRVGTSTYSGSFSYSGSYLTFTVPFTGTYTIECWGASGGGVSPQSGTGTIAGGLGGYVKGQISLEKEQALFIYIGERGGDNIRNNSLTFNGGGGCYWFKNGTDVYKEGRGGGATDVRVIKSSETKTIWNETTSLRSRIIVAAGGGGASNWRETLAGSPAGGLLGYNGTTYKSTTGTETNAKGGGQTIGGAGFKWAGESANSNSGGFGYGGTGNDTYVNGGGFVAGGGSGWYGGGSGGVQPSVVGTAGGGSSFISGHPGCNSVNPSTGVHLGASTIMTINGKEYRFDNGTTQMIDGSGKEWTSASQTTGGSAVTMPTPPGGTISGGNVGNGYCRITGTTAP